MKKPDLTLVNKQGETIMKLDTLYIDKTVIEPRKPPDWRVALRINNKSFFLPPSLSVEIINYLYGLENKPPVRRPNDRI